MTLLDLSKFELDALPTSESDGWEFKSSATPIKELKKKLSCAVSGFANAGGGCFVAGVDGNGNADGGFPKLVRKQDFGDWVDQVAHLVSPTPNYAFALITDPKGRGTIKADHHVLVVSVDESYSGPHMAPDNRYYIRAGAHTVAARHFIVDAIWAKRHFGKPRLIHNWRIKPGCHDVIQLGVVSLTNNPAIDVSINLDPLGELLKGSEDRFPLKLPLIDPDNSFYLDATTWFKSDERFGENVKLTVTYHDLSGNEYKYETNLNSFSGLAPVRIGTDANTKMAKSLKKIEKLLGKIAK